ncbi:MAG: RNA repair transcriptional activator RtcR family protein [Opitutaceae bacterium]
MSRRTLVTFVGLRDPYYHDAHDDGRQKGPVLTVLDERRYDRVVLLGRPHRQEQLDRTCAALKSLHPKLSVEVRSLPLSDSTYHPEILSELRRVLSQLLRDTPKDDFSISLLSGTPEIHACWVLIAVSGEFPARLLNVQRTVHNGIAGPRALRELDWSEPLAAITPETLGLLAGRRERNDDSELQDPAITVPRHTFARRTLEQAVGLSRHTAPLLITGEPGTQKHYLAALVHRLSNRNSGPLIIFNCATLPATLFESVLFGEPGDEGSGKLDQAEGGTLVLLKLQQVPGELLARLLKALEDGYHYDSRSRVPRRINVRLIGTTDRDLEEEVRHSRFPADVWQRLQSSLLRVPPLRERAADITPLAQDELDRLNRRLPRPRRFSAGALAKLGSHTWPSNVSELRRVIDQAVLNAEQPTIQASDIDLDLGVNLANVFSASAPRIRHGFSLEDYLRNVKHEIVRSALKKTGDNQSEAARLLGVTPQAVSKYAKALKRSKS